MKSNELRIGNWIADRGLKEWQIDHWETINKVSSKASTSMFMGIMMETHPLTEYVDYLRPIPLTDEWLLKFGFTPDERKIVYDHPLPKEPENEHKDLGTKYPAFFMNNRLNRWMDCHTRVCIDYVHQLQNLYFTLTGEELEVKQ